jgi:hypothetical protein
VPPAHHNAFDDRLSAVVKLWHHSARRGGRPAPPFNAPAGWQESLLLLLPDLEPAAESLNLPGCIDDALRTRVERVAIGADIDA